MKAFKNQLKQPEAWLRENLEDVAVLHKTGPFANHWELKPSYQRPATMEAAPDAAGGDDDDDDGDDDDENIQMEDVTPL